jgi:hypothetical protein
MPFPNNLEEAAHAAEDDHTPQRRQLPRDTRTVPVTFHAFNSQSQGGGWNMSWHSPSIGFSSHIASNKSK